MTFIRGFGQFWYDFIIGDDWKIAVAVVTSLVVLFVCMSVIGLSDAWTAVIGCLAIMGLFVVSMAVDVRRSS